MADPINLAAERAARSDNALDWSPRDALVKALEEIDAGLIDPQVIYIAFVTKPHWSEDGVLVASYDHYAAGGTNIEVAGLLAVHLAKQSAGI